MSYLIVSLIIKVQAMLIHFLFIPILLSLLIYFIFYISLFHTFIIFLFTVSIVTFTDFFSDSRYVLNISCCSIYLVLFSLVLVTLRYIYSFISNHCVSISLLISTDHLSI